MSINELPLWVYLILKLCVPSIVRKVSAMDYWRLRKGLIEIVKTLISIHLHPDFGVKGIRLWFLRKVDRWADRELTLCDSWLGLIESTGLITSGVIHA
jgi:hypothetical protein